MKPNLKGMLLLAAGALVGALCVAAVFAVRESQRFRDRYYADILENANVAYMLATGLEKELVENIEANLGQCVTAADRLYGKTEKRLTAFWLVQRYFEKTGRKPPPEIIPILAALPPRPLTSCEIKAKAQSTQGAEQPAGGDGKPAPQP